LHSNRSTVLNSPPSWLRNSPLSVGGRPGNLGLPLFLVGGVALWLAYPPIGLFPLAWVALVPLWLWVSQPDPLPQRAWLGPWAWAVLAYAPSLRWILDLHPLTWMGVPWWSSLLIATGCWLFLVGWGAFQVSIWCGVIRWLPQRPVWKLLSGTALWVLLDAFQSRGSLYWLPLSLSQSPGDRPLLFLGQISGPQSVTALILLVNGLLALAILRQTPSRRCWLGATLATLVSAHLLGGILWLTSQPDPSDQRLRVGVIQGNVPTRTKLTAAGIRQAFEVYSRGYRTLADEGAAVVLTSEGALPLLWDQQFANPLIASVQDKQIPLWLGSFWSEGDRYQQSLLQLNGEAEVTARYNKIRLVPLGEFIPEPLGAILGRLSPLPNSMQPGAIKQRFSTPWGMAAVAICYEVGFPNLLGSAIHDGAELLLTASNLDPYNQILMAQHRAHSQMRAIEFDRWLVQATNTGYSGTVAPTGQVTLQLGPHEAAWAVSFVYRRRGLTLYARWGDWLTPLLCALAIASLVQQLRQVGEFRRH
jgi:apolipoprotein N-acyltransferase